MIVKSVGILRYKWKIEMNRDEILKTNKHYWDTYADLWFGTTALPAYGVHFVTEDELHLFGDVSGKKMLEICCGSGHSLKYHADRNAGELWGVDLSHKQLENAKRYLNENGYTANFICSPMEADMNIPKEYFDFVYSIYGIGWTTDLDGTFRKIASYLKKTVSSFSAGIIHSITALPGLAMNGKM